MHKIKTTIKKLFLCTLALIMTITTISPITYKIYAFDINDWNAWQLKIDADMLESYKIHAAEVNVNNLKSTTVQNVTEAINEYGETDIPGNLSGKAWASLKQRAQANWKMYNEAFKISTGFTRKEGEDFYFMMPAYAAGHDFNNEQNEVSKKIADWRNWDSDQDIGQELIATVEKYIESGTNGYPAIKETINKKINDPINNMSTADFNNISETKYNVPYKTAQTIFNNLYTQWKNRWANQKVINIEISPNRTIELEYETQYKLTGKPTTENFLWEGSTYNYSQKKWYYNMGYRYKDKGSAKFILIETACGLDYNSAKNNNSKTVYQQVIEYALATNPEDTTDIFASLRIELVKIIAEHIYNQFADAFWVGASNYAGVQGLLTSHLTTLNKIYGEDSKAYAQYKNFIYGTNEPISSVWFNQRSAYYFPFNETETMIMGFEIEKRGEYVLYDENEILKFMNEEYMGPLYCELIIDPDTCGMQYIAWLNSSIIVKNELNHYEYWMENLSNKYDTTYYGEPKQIPLNDEKDPNLTAEEQSLVPSQHWGTLLYTRYKYVDYTYYIYYAFNDYAKQSVMTLIVADDTLCGWETRNSYAKGKPLNPNITIPRIGQVTGTEDQPYVWVHASTRPNAKSVIDYYKNKYWLTDDQISSQATVVIDHLAAERPETTGGGSVGVIWGGEDRYDNSWWSWANSKAELRTVNGIRGYGDFYRYDEPVRAEVTYFKVLVPNTADGTVYELCLGETAPCKNNNGCLTGPTLCECNEEMGGDNACDELEGIDFEISSTLVE